MDYTSKRINIIYRLKNNNFKSSLVKNKALLQDCASLSK